MGLPSKYVTKFGLNVKDFMSTFFLLIDDFKDYPPFFYIDRPLFTFSDLPSWTESSHSSFISMPMVSF